MHFYTRHVARAFIYDIERKEFLIAKGVLPPFDFHLPGGGLDEGETAEQALRRELKEELNIDSEHILSLKYLGDANQNIMFIHHNMEIFYITVKNPELSKCWEISTLTWVPLEKLDQYLSKPVLSCLDYSMVK